MQEQTSAEPGPGYLQAATASADFRRFGVSVNDDTVLPAVRRQSFNRHLEAMANFLPAFFTNPDTLAALCRPASRPLWVEYGWARSSKHLLSQSLLRTATHAPVTVDEVADEIQRTLSARLEPEVKAIITALLTLVAWAFFADAARV